MLSIFTDFLNFTGQWVLSRLYLRFTSTFCIFLYWQNKSQICQNSKLFVFMLIFPVALLDAIKQLIWNTNTYQHKRSDNNCDSNNFFPPLITATLSSLSRMQKCSCQNYLQPLLLLPFQQENIESVKNPLPYNRYWLRYKLGMTDQETAKGTQKAGKK